MSDLTDRQLKALRALEKLGTGQSTFVNWNDAEALIEIGLAESSGKGYAITEMGRAALREKS